MDPPSPVTEAGSVLRKPASEEAIESLERRLGVTLPPSYRSFFLLADGAWAQPGWGLVGLAGGPDDENVPGILDAARVGWFRDREPSYVDIWGLYGLDSMGTPGNGDPAFARHVPECEYLDHERQQDPVQAKPGHVRHALQVSGDVDGYTVLLDPLVVDGEGEWEAWDMGSKLPGAYRHRSFAGLLAADVARLEGEADDPGPDPGELAAVAVDTRKPARERASAPLRRPACVRAARRDAARPCAAAGEARVAHSPATWPCDRSVVPALVAAAAFRECGSCLSARPCSGSAPGTKPSPCSRAPLPRAILVASPRPSSGG